MIITAKYASVCPCCSSQITVGAKVEWSRGAKAVHVVCAGKPTSPASFVANGVVNPHAFLAANGRGSAPRARRTGCSCGSLDGVSRPSDCRQCRFDNDDC